MLEVCFDTARTKITEGVVLVAGFAGFAGVWKDFETAWQARLERDGLTHFHAGDFAQFHGQFKTGWREDEKRRQGLLADLMDIITVHGLRRFGCCVPLFVQEKIDPAIQNFNAYVHAAHASVDEFQQYARENGVIRDVRYVFEKGEREVELRARFRDAGYEEPDFEWNRRTTDRKGFVRDGFLGLQAAGWLAYEYYLDALRVVIDLSKPVSQIENGRWAFRQFEQMPGRIQFAASSRVSEAAMKIRDASTHLAKIAKKRRPRE